MSAVDDVVRELRDLNDRIAAGSLFLSSFDGRNDSEGLMKNIQFFGMNLAEVVFLSLTPDGDDTVVGRLMTRRGDIYFFDFDLDDCELSSLTKVEAQKNSENVYDLRSLERLEEIAGRFLIDERG